jgi:hypothetical protein
MDLRDLDLEAISARYERTFARENDDRPVFRISYGLGVPVDDPPAPPTVRERWFDFEWRLERFERSLANAGFLCEGFPDYFCNLGPDILAACTGSELVFESDGTSWARFRVADWRDEPPLAFQEDGFYWQQLQRFLTLAAERGRGKWIVQSGDLHTNGDGLAALRGPQGLLLDLVDCPDEVQRRLEECHAVFARLLDEHLAIILPASGGYSSSWCGALCKGRYAAIQNDFSCMVGRSMFDEFFAPYVEREAALLDHCVYHLDGPDAMRHVDSLCAAPSLDLVQWVPGAGQPGFDQWPAFLQRIQANGKGLWIHGSPAEQLNVLRQVEPAGCVYNLGFGKREDAEDWLRAAEAILAERR